MDGVIDIPRTKSWDLGHEDAKLSPDAVSEVVVSRGLKIALKVSTDCGFVLASAYPAAHDVCFRN